MKRLTAITRTGAVLVSVLLVGACSGHGSAPTPTPTLAAVYRATIDQDLAQHPSDLIRQVLADYQITDGELHDVQQAFVDCLHKASPHLDASFNDDGGYSIGPADVFEASLGKEKGDAKFDQVEGDCQRENLGDILTLYRDLHVNPQGFTTDELIRRCFKAHGITDADGLTDAQLEDLIDQHHEQMSEEAIQCVLGAYNGKSS